MKNKLLPFTFLLVILTNCDLSAQNWKWTRSSSCSIGWGNDFGLIEMDRTSELPGLYAVGFNMGNNFCIGSYTIPNVKDTAQAIVVKYDTSGNILWTLNSTKGYCAPTNITTDKAGNLYILGMLYTDSAVFGAHTILNTNYIVGRADTNHCYFIVKIDPLGTVLWAKCGGNVEEKGANLKIGGIAVGESGDVFVCASFDDSILNIESHFFTNAHADSGDVFLAKYDASGNYMWCKTFGNVSDDHCEQMRMGSNGKLYVSGYFGPSGITFGSFTLTRSGLGWGENANAFLVEMDTSGSALWATSPTGTCTLKGMAIDKQNNIYISGHIADTAMTVGTYSFHNPDLYWGSYFAKYDSAGVPQWSKFLYPLTHTTSGSLSINIWEIGTDPCNNVWISGMLMPDSIGMNGSTLFSSKITGSEPLLLAGFNSSGTLLQSYSFAEGGDDNTGMTFDCRGNIYLVGDVRTKLVLGTDTVKNYGGAENMFVAKFDPGLGCNDCPSPADPLIQNSKLMVGGIKLYPNPASDKCTISYDGRLYEKAKVEIYDIAGRMLHSYPLVGGTTIIPMDDLADGVYICHIDVTGEGFVSRKLVIAR